MARGIALGDAALAEDIAQEARIQLWKMGVDKVNGMHRRMVRTVLMWRMTDASREQWSKGGGLGKVVVHLRVA
jgi:hypothetical protein